MSFQNSTEVAKYLQDNKIFNPESINELKTFQKPIHLYQLGTITKWLFLVSRYQVYIYCIGITGYTSYTIYNKSLKFSKDLIRLRRGEITPQKQKAIDTINQKYKKMAFLGCSLLVTSIFGMYLTLKMARVLPRSIYYLPEQSKFKIDYFSYFGGTQSTNYPINSVSLNPKKGILNKSCEFLLKNENGKLSRISTKGPGNWSNKSLFQYIIQQ